MPDPRVVFLAPYGITMDELVNRMGGAICGQAGRFTLAHELGHHLLRHADQFHLDFGGEL